MGQKIVINKCFGGFGMSHEAVMRYLELSGTKVWPEDSGSFIGHTYWIVPPEERRPELTPEQWANMTREECIAHNNLPSQTFYDRDVKRDDPVLVQVVEELGTEKASGRYGALHVVDIPDGIEWTIEEYDGNEHVAQVHQTWR